MMFNWNEQDQVEGKMWPDLMASEDHIVPHPMETEENNLFPLENYEKNKNTECVISNMRSTETKNNNHRNKSESNSDFLINEELSSKTEIDSWLDIPDTCMELEDKYNDGDNHDKMTMMMNDLTDASALNPVGGDFMQLEFDPGLIGHDNRNSGAFLECDWDNIQDFDDIESFFSKDESIFSQTKIDNADGFHSRSKDVIDITAQPIPIPDLRICKDQSYDEGCSSFLLDHQSEEQGSSLEKQKGNEQKMKLAYEKTTKERSKNKLSSLNDNHTKNQPLSNSNSLSSITNLSQSFHVSPINLPMQFGESKLLEDHKSSNHTAFVKLTYPSYPYIQTNANQHRSVLPGKEIHLRNAEHHTNFNRILDSEAAMIMTPEEKMEKLRRLQKLQAQLAIEQQHQQYSPQISPIDESSKNIFSSKKDESKNVLCQLQEVVEKLDMKTRCCIRDSLFRLAKSAAERSIGDRSSTSNSKKDEDGMSVDKSRNHDRVSRLEDTETDTNPIDRVVANLLFQRPAETFPRIGPSQPHSST